MAVRITEIDPGSPAHKAGIQAGETLISLNGNPIVDVLDYRFYMTEEHLSLLLATPEGKTRTLQIDKGEYEDLGLEFETYLMDKQMSCKNNCIFCFVDQMPQGMRPSLYFKDDDNRLSFFFGNYITLTNLKEGDIRRIIKMRISPINISIHTTNPDLRQKMMRNPRAGEVLAYVKMLTDAGIHINTQLVLCPGFNDGEELKRSLKDLLVLTPALQSIAVVPVGLTRHRENLFPLRLFTPEEAGEVIDIVHSFSEDFLRKTGHRVAYPADEFFLRAARPLPPAEYYEEFSQLENGVGLMASLKEEFYDALALMEEPVSARRVTMATGVAAAPFIEELSRAVMERFPQVKIRVQAIRNRFFGETITVAGLVTGQDLLGQLKGQELGEELLIPAVMLRHEQDKFLDDLLLTEAEEQLGVPIRRVENDGFVLLDAMLGLAEA